MPADGFEPVQTRREQQSGAGGFTSTQVAEILARIVMDYDESFREVVGKGFSRQRNAISIGFDESYDTSNPDQKNRFIYGDRRVFKGRTVSFELRAINLGALRRIVNRLFGNPVRFGQIEARLERSLRYSTEVDEAKGVDFRSGGDRDYAYVVHHANWDEEVRILLDRALTPLTVGDVDDVIKNALDGFAKELNWQWFGSKRE